MQRHWPRLAKPLLLGLAALLLPAIFALVSAGEPGAVQAGVLSAKPVPHDLAGREECLLCHGPGSALAVPTDHAGRIETTCQACHAPAAPSTPPQTGGAAAPASQPVPTLPAGLPASDAACLACHQSSAKATLANGETFDAALDVKEIADSEHRKAVSCTACHADQSGGYPHQKIQAADRRAYATAQAAQCAGCHKDVGTKFAQSVHGDAITLGKTNAATCTDCHGVHNISSASRLGRRPQLCATCHAVVTDTYRDSVHGKLQAQGRNDAASCLDCHTSDNSGHSLVAVKDAQGPTADRNVPDTCGKCHQEPLKTYNTTFHGKAMRLGVTDSAPNCVDCHGAYGVQRVHAAESKVSETTFATACAKCHQGASESFASGWMGHEEASPTWFPLVFFTERFLFFLTTSVVAFGIVHVELDLLRWLVRKRNDGNRKEGKKL